MLCLYIYIALLLICEAEGPRLNSASVFPSRQKGAVYGHYLSVRGLVPTMNNTSACLTPLTIRTVRTQTHSGGHSVALGVGFSRRHPPPPPSPPPPEIPVLVLTTKCGGGSSTDLTNQPFYCGSSTDLTNQPFYSLGVRPLAGWGGEGRRGSFCRVAAEQRPFLVRRCGVSGSDHHLLPLGCCCVPSPEQTANG